MTDIPRTAASATSPSTSDAGRSALALAGVMSADLRERVDGLRARRTPFVVATVVRAERPTSAKAGDRALILPDGTLEGFVGGTCAESTVKQYGLRLLAGGRSTLLRITPSLPLGADDLHPPHVHDSPEHRTTLGVPGSPSPGPAQPGVPGGRPAGPAQPGVPRGRPPGPAQPAAATSPDLLVDQGGGAGADSDGMVTVSNPCLSGGTLEIFLEAVVPPALIHVHGAAPVARALQRLGSAVGFDVEVSTDPGSPLAPDTGAVVVASHGRDEEAVLEGALRAAVPYVGLVASRRRGAMVLSGLDVPEDERARVHTPAGLDIGARTAPEIALSILAEIVATRTPAASGIPTASAFPVGEPAGRGGPTAESGHPSRPTEGARPDGGAEAVDPVCGMTVAVSPSSLRYEYQGQVYYFCGAGCRQAFAADPASYL